MTLAEELARKHGFGTQHPAFRAAVDEALERAAQVVSSESTIESAIIDEYAARIRAMKSESPDGQA